MRRNGRQEVGASHSTADPGEPPEGPWGGKEAPSFEPLEGNMPGTPRPDPVSTKQQRIAELARNCPDMAFTNLAHHIDIEWMLTAHGHTRRNGAVGVDGQNRGRIRRSTLRPTFRTSSTECQIRHARVACASSAHPQAQARPNETRPLGMLHVRGQNPPACGADGAGTAVHETDFLDVSHGFRPWTRCSWSIGLTVETGDGKPERHQDRGR